MKTLSRIRKGRYRLRGNLYSKLQTIKIVKSFDLLKPLLYDLSGNSIHSDKPPASIRKVFVGFPGRKMP